MSHNETIAAIEFRLKIRRSNLAEAQRDNDAERIARMEAHITELEAEKKRMEAEA